MPTLANATMFCFSQYRNSHVHKGKGSFYIAQYPAVGPLKAPHTNYIMKARKSVESLEQNLAETIAKAVDKMNIFLPGRVKSVLII